MHSIENLLELHRRLDNLLEKQNNSKPFISDWNCSHPFYNNINTGILINESEIKNYSYIRESDILSQLVMEFHNKSENNILFKNQLVHSNGSSTIIAAFFIWLKSNNYNYIYYIPPIYFTFHYLSKIYNIHLRPITKDHLFNDQIKLNLPNKKSLLLITDPVWYAGVSVSEVLIKSIKSWQLSTDSLIFIDGSFQYFKWNKSKIESTGLLDSELTFRLICPTKAIATHGFRYAYLIVPQKHQNDLSIILDYINGSSNIYDIKLAQNCMKQLISVNSNNELIDFTKNAYITAINNGIFSTSIIPDCGYFIYAKMNPKFKNKYNFMDAGFFEERKYCEYIRINLLSSALKNLNKTSIH